MRKAMMATMMMNRLVYRDRYWLMESSNLIMIVIVRCFMA
jgi:hypothetical protein